MTAREEEWRELEGPWQHEPDRKHWVDEATGLDCLIVRNRMGNLCGYVGVPEGHPWFGKSYYDDGVDVTVHGGLTYADKCVGHICHSRDKGDDVANEEVWWLGFDCGHAWDIAPAMILTDRKYGLETQMGSYKTIDYVAEECRELARQVAESA